MKKQYIQPSLLVVEMVYTTTLLSASSLSVTSTTLDADDALSREFDYDDDFDE